MNISMAFVRGALIVAGLLAAILIGTAVTTSSFVPLAVTGGVILTVFTVGAPEWLLLISIVCSELPGRTALSVGYWEIFSFALIARWAFIVPFRGGLFGRIRGKFTFICISIFMFILFSHGLPSLLGRSGNHGSRLAIMAFISIVLSYLILSEKLDLSKLQWLPWAGLLPGIILTTFDLVNLTIPALIPISVMLYDNQNWEILANFGGSQLSTIRIAGFRDLGLGIAFLCLAYFARPRFAEHKFVAAQVAGTVFGALLTLIAGYRSYVAQVILGTFLAAYARSKSTLILAFICTIFGLVGLSFVHYAITPLPLTVQRAISWMPGDWDWRTKSEADDGYEWRSRIRSIYFDTIFPDSWLLGRGLAYDDRSDAMKWMASDPDLNVDYFVLMQCYHSGLVSALDFVGVTGTLFLVAGCLRAGWNCLIIFRRRNSAQPWHIWMALMFVTVNPPYWYTGFFNLSFPFFALSMSLLEVARRQLDDTPSSEVDSPVGEVDYEIEESVSSH